MSEQEKHQISLIMKHLEKADNATNTEDRDLHEMIVRHLFAGLDAKYNYEADALLNTAQAIA